MAEVLSASAEEADPHRVAETAVVSGPALDLSDVKLFLRVDHHDHDFHIARLAERAAKAIEAELGTALAPTSPAPLRLAALMLVLRAYEGDGREMPIAPVEAWIAPYRKATTAASSSSVGNREAIEPKPPAPSSTSPGTAEVES